MSHNPSPLQQRPAALSLATSSVNAADASAARGGRPPAASFSHIPASPAASGGGGGSPHPSQHINNHTHHQHASSLLLPPPPSPLEVARRIATDYRLLHAFARGLPHEHGAATAAALAQLVGRAGVPSGQPSSSAAPAVVAASAVYSVASGSAASFAAREDSATISLFGVDGSDPTLVRSHFLRSLLAIELDAYLCKERQRVGLSSTGQITSSRKEAITREERAQKRAQMNIFGYLRGNTVASLALDGILNTQLPPAAVTAPIVTSLGVRGGPPAHGVPRRPHGGSVASSTRHPSQTYPTAVSGSPAPQQCRGGVNNNNSINTTATTNGGGPLGTRLVLSGSVSRAPSSAALLEMASGGSPTRVAAAPSSPSVVGAMEAEDCPSPVFIHRANSVGYPPTSAASASPHPSSSSGAQRNEASGSDPNGYYGGGGQRDTSVAADVEAALLPSAAAEETGAADVALEDVALTVASPPPSPQRNNPTAVAASASQQSSPLCTRQPSAVSVGGGFAFAQHGLGLGIGLGPAPLQAVELLAPLALVARNDAEEVPAGAIAAAGDALIARLTALLAALGRAASAWPPFVLLGLLGTCRAIDDALGSLPSPAQPSTDGGSGSDCADDDEAARLLRGPARTFLNTAVLLRYVAPRILALAPAGDDGSALQQLGTPASSSAASSVAGSFGGGPQQQQLQRSSTLGSVPSSQHQQQSHQNSIAALRAAASVYARALQKVANGQPCFPLLSACSFPEDAAAADALDAHMALLNGEVAALNARVLAEVGPLVTELYAVLLRTAMAHHSAAPVGVGAVSSSVSGSVSALAAEGGASVSTPTATQPNSPGGAAWGVGGASSAAPHQLPHSQQAHQPPPLLLRSLVMAHCAALVEAMGAVSPLTQSSHGALLLGLVGAHHQHGSHLHLPSHAANAPPSFADEVGRKGGAPTEPASERLWRAFVRHGHTTLLRPLQLLGAQRGVTGGVAAAGPSGPPSPAMTSAMTSSSEAAVPNLSSSSNSNAAAALTTTAHAHQFAIIAGQYSPIAARRKRIELSHLSSQGHANGIAIGFTDGRHGHVHVDPHGKAGAMNGSTSGGGGGGGCCGCGAADVVADERRRAGVAEGRVDDDGAEEEGALLVIEGGLLRIAAEPVLTAMNGTGSSTIRAALARAIPQYQRPGGACVDGALPSAVGGSSASSASSSPLSAASRPAAAAAAAAAAGGPSSGAAAVSPLLSATPLDGDLVAHVAMHLNVLLMGHGGDGVVTNNSNTPPASKRRVTVVFVGGDEEPAAAEGAAVSAAKGNPYPSHNASFASSSPPNAAPFGASWVRALFSPSTSPFPPRVLSCIERVVICRSPPPPTSATASAGTSSLKEKMLSVFSGGAKGLFGTADGGGGGASITAVTAAAGERSSPLAFLAQRPSFDYIADPSVLVDSLGLSEGAASAFGLPLGPAAATVIRKMGSATDSNNGCGGNGDSHARAALALCRTASQLLCYARDAAAASFSGACTSGGNNLLGIDLTQRCPLMGAFREDGVEWLRSLGTHGPNGAEGAARFAESFFSLASSNADHPSSPPSMSTPSPHSTALNPQLATLCASLTGGAPWAFAEGSSSLPSAPPSPLSSFSADAAAQQRQARRVRFANALTALLAGPAAVAQYGTAHLTACSAPSGGLTAGPLLGACGASVLLQTVPLRPLWRVVLALLWMAARATAMATLGRKVSSAVLGYGLVPTFALPEVSSGEADGTDAAFSPPRSQADVPPSLFPPSAADALSANLRSWYGHHHSAAVDGSEAEDGYDGSAVDSLRRLIASACAFAGDLASDGGANGSPLLDEKAVVAAQTALTDLLGLLTAGESREGGDAEARLLVESGVLLVPLRHRRFAAAALEALSLSGAPSSLLALMAV